MVAPVCIWWYCPVWEVCFVILPCCKVSKPEFAGTTCMQRKATCAHDVWHKKNASERISTATTLLAENCFVPLWTHGICRVSKIWEGVQFSVPNISQLAKWEHTSLKLLALSSSNYLKARLEMHEPSTSRWNVMFLINMIWLPEYLSFCVSLMRPRTSVYDLCSLLFFNQSCKSFMEGSRFHSKFDLGSIMTQAWGCSLHSESSHECFL